MFLYGHRYQAEDEDELSLEVGDVVQVIEYEDPEEQVMRRLLWFFGQLH